MANATPGAPKKGGLKKLVIFGVVGLLVTGAGAAVPLLLPAKEANGSGGKGHGSEGDGHRSGQEKPAFVPFGDVVVNLAEERLTRYLRVKLVLVVDHLEEKEMTEELAKSKAILKNWLIGYLSDKSLKEVNGAANVNRLRREIQEQFNSLLGAGRVDRVHDVLFEEFVVQ
jgi:flagellar FliL protein